MTETDQTGYRKRILVVDDEEGIRRSLARVLASGGYEVRTASDGYRAVEIAEQFSPDLALMDIRMPGMDGVTTFQRLRDNLPSLVGIFMTAFSSCERSDAAEENGAIEILGKPLDPSLLMDLVESSLHAAPILIAEDDPDLLQSIARSLEANGIQVELAPSLREAARALRRRPTRVVISDVFLEDGFGYELLQEIETHPSPLPFILITGRSNWMTSELAEKLQGRVTCLVKPVDMDELLQQLSR